jgi:hypothetical protein
VLFLGTTDQNRHQGEVINYDGSGNTGNKRPQFFDDEAALDGAQSTTAI